MSQYFRTIVIPEESRKAVSVKDGMVVVDKDLVADIVIHDEDDEITDEMTSIDFSGVRSRMTICKGFRASYPLPGIVVLLLSLIGVKFDPASIAVLAAMYEEGGFSEYGREECDKMYLNTLLNGSNWIVRTLFYGILLMLIGNDYKWNNDSDETTVATLMPIWN
jgi:hypothetical protein